MPKDLLGRLLLDLAGESLGSSFSAGNSRKMRKQLKRLAKGKVSPLVALAGAGILAETLSGGSSTLQGQPSPPPRAVPPPAPPAPPRSAPPPPLVPTVAAGTNMPPPIPTAPLPALPVVPLGAAGTPPPIPLGHRGVVPAMPPPIPYSAPRPIEPPNHPQRREPAPWPTLPAPPTPPPLPKPPADDLAPRLLYPLVRTLVAAALADGHLSGAEKEVFLRHLKGSGFDQDQLHQLRRDLAMPATRYELALLLAETLGEEEMAHRGGEARELLYRTALAAVMLDQRRDSAEDRWLRGFARILKLPEVRRHAAERQAASLDLGALLPIVDSEAPSPTD